MTGYYRVACPLWALEQRGHTVAWLEMMPEEVIGSSAWDVIVGQRISLPGPSSIWQRLASEQRATLVYEIDDDLLNVDASNKSAHAYYNAQVQPVAVQTSLREYEFRTIEDRERRQRIIDNITVADLVTVSTEPLAAVVSQWNPNVVVLPNCVPAEYLDHQRPVADERLTVGWRGGPSHSRDFGEMARPVKAFLQKHSRRVEFHGIGADYTERVASLRARTRHTGWQPIESFIRSVDFDLGVIPLRPSPFNDSKSDLALLELAALGIPVVASATGPYQRAVDEGAPALLAANSREWTDRLTELLDDKRRTELGAAAYEWSRSRTIQSNVWRWEQAYTEALRGRRAAA